MHRLTLTSLVSIVLDILTHLVTTEYRWWVPQSTSSPVGGEVGGEGAVSLRHHHAENQGSSESEPSSEC